MNTTRGTKLLLFTFLALQATACTDELDGLDSESIGEDEDEDEDTDGDGDGDDDDDGDDEHEGIAPGTCEEVEAQVKRQLIKTMTARTQERLQAALVAYQYGCQDPTDEGDESDEGDDDDDGAANVGKRLVADTDQAQSPGEADFVVHQDGYIYALADGQFQVLDAWPADATERIAALPIEGTPLRMHIHADTAVVYAQRDGLWPEPPALHCEHGCDDQPLQISVLDISDPAEPRLTRELAFDGAYADSRRVGTSVHTLVAFPEVETSLEQWPQGLPPMCELHELEDSFAAIHAHFNQLIDINIERIEAAPIDELLPRMEDTRYAGGSADTDAGLLSACGSIFAGQTKDARGFVSLVSFELDEQQPVAATTLISATDGVYATDASMYVASRHFGDWGREDWLPYSNNANEATFIHGFDLRSDGQAAPYMAQGAVPFSLFDARSMSEREGLLRVATHSRELGLNAHRIYSLGRDGTQLVRVEHTSEFAGEMDVSSVLFRDQLAYVVTSARTNPMFVVDLSDPDGPWPRTELAVPTQPSYMSLTSDQQLLSLGYTGGSPDLRGVELRAIDVYEDYSAQLRFEEELGLHSAAAIAHASTHFELEHFESRGLVFVPTTLCDPQWQSDNGPLMSFSGQLVYRFDPNEGFEYLGGIPHAEPDTLGGESQGCQGWWDELHTRPERTVFAEDWVYSIARDKVVVAHLDDLDQPVASVDLIAN